MTSRGFCASSLALPLAAGAVGAVVGLLAGGRAVKVYDWRTEWFIPAPLPVVYEAMTSRSAVRRWWPSIELVDDSGEDDVRAGSSFDVSVLQSPEVARLAPPFRIHCVYTDVEPERRLREIVTGDLSGVLETLFEENRDGTHVAFNWYVRLTNPVLNLLGYAAQGAYLRSHDGVMRAGESGLREYCGRMGAERRR